MSISRRVSHLTGKIQSAGVERQFAVEHLRCKARRAISAAYDFDLTAGDYTLADGAIEAVIERAPWSAFINPSQSRELIFYGQSARLRRRRHALNAGKFRHDLQKHVSAR